MDQKYFDEEEVHGVEAVSESSSRGSFDTKGATAMYYNKKEAGLERTKMTVLLELTGTEGATGYRPGLDIVIVLDVSGSMAGDNMKHLKIAAKFLIKKLSPVDRLSVVTFSTTAERYCHLRLMTRDAQSYVEDKIIEKLDATYSTNISAGLEEAVQVLNDRRFTEKRQAAIMLLSDGNPDNKSCDGSNVFFGDVPVHTFGLGQRYHPEVLRNIAAKSKGGTFNTSDIENPDSSNLSNAFAICLAGLLNIAVNDLTLVITKERAEIEKVSAGNYKQSQDDSEGTVTIPFGNLYSRETRSILVDLVLPEVNEPKGTDALEFSYFYRNANETKKRQAAPVTITISRTTTPSGKEVPEVLNERARQDTADKMKEARISADNQQFGEATKKLDVAKKDLERDELDQSHPLIKGLLAEVNQFAKLVKNAETYEKLGRAFAYASELSHSLQRAAARGNVKEIQLFAIKAVEQLINQVQDFEKDPKKPVPTDAEDLEKRQKEDPMPVPIQPQDPIKVIAAAISTHLEEAINSLKAIQDLVNNTSS